MGSEMCIRDSHRSIARLDNLCFGKPSAHLIVFVLGNLLNCLICSSVDCDLLGCAFVGFEDRSKVFGYSRQSSKNKSQTVAVSWNKNTRRRKNVKAMRMRAKFSNVMSIRSKISWRSSSSWVLFSLEWLRGLMVILSLFGSFMPMDRRLSLAYVSSCFFWEVEV